MKPDKRKKYVTFLGTLKKSLTTSRLKGNASRPK
jgi:hypothetical protein